MKPIKQTLMSGAIMLALSLVFTSCEDILGTWDKPAPAVVTPSEPETPSVAPAATITTAPTATADVKAGSTTELVTAGVADGGTMMYKVTNDNTKPTSTDVFDATVPTAATLAAGTFYVWYYAKADATHSDSEIAATAIEVTVKIPGLLSGKFTINGNATNNQVQFSQGNLQFKASPSTWRFAEHQYDYVGDATNGNVSEGATKCNNALISSSYTGWIDLFGWGTSGHEFTSGYGTAYQPYSTSTNNTHYGPLDGTSLTGTYAQGDWGINMGTGWRTLTKDEWNYLLNTRTTTSGIRYAMATVNSVTGLILLPDDWNTSYYVISTNKNFTANVITLVDWTDKLEAHGAVFLPAAGYRYNTDVHNAAEYGQYWSSSNKTTEYAYKMRFYNGFGSLSPTDNNHDYGMSVRLVYPVQ